MARKWTNEEINLVKKVWSDPLKKAKDIVEILGRTEASINQKAKGLGLTKTRLNDGVAEGFKHCSKCKKLRPIELYYKHGDTKNSWCKICCQYSKQKGKMKKTLRKKDEVKTCSKCKQTKNVTEFRKNNQRKCYRQPCKICEQIKRKERNLKRLEEKGY